MRQERRQRLQGIFPDDVLGWEKADVLYDLARGTNAPIAEVGCSHGIGTIALAFGSIDGGGFPVYAIDPFFPVRGWANEPYGPWLKEIWLTHLMEAGVVPVVQIVMAPVNDIDLAIGFGLTFWNLGMRLQDPVDLWLAKWCQYQTWEGGLVAINETGGDDLGVDEWLASQNLVEKRDLLYNIRIAART